MASKPKLILYLDIVSPFAYLAYHVIRHSPVFAQCEVTYVPVFLGGIMKACSNTPPLYIKNKGPYSDYERRRWARMFDIPMRETLPPGFPANMLPVQRVLTAVDIMFPERLLEALDLLYHASFADHLAVYERECLTALLQKLFGAEKTEDILQRSRSNDVRTLLTTRTEEVIEKGSFGLPWYIATNAAGKTDHFWGFDHTGAVASHLGLARPEPSSTGASAWRAML